MDFEALYAQYKQDVFRYLCSLTGYQAEAEELLAETFFRAFMGFYAFRGESSVKTWLFSIARHVFFQQIKAKGRSIPTEDTLLYQLRADTNLAAYTFEDETMLLELVNQLLAQKDERSRTVFQMRLDGYSFREIGEAVGISESSARVVEHRVRIYLRNELRKEGYGQ